MLIDKNEIATKLRKLKSIIPRKMGGTEFDGVLLKGNSLYVTNLEIGIKAALDVENTNEEFVIPKNAIELIENLPSGTVEIIGDGKCINIKCGSIKNKYQTVPANTYPAMDSSDNNDNEVTIESGAFQDALNSVLYAVSERIMKEAMKGVLLEASGGTLNIVGCDGCRLAWSKIKYNGDFKVIIPKATIQKILSIGISGNMSFAWDSNSITFRSSEYEVVSRIISGEYMDYKKLFVEYANETVIDRRLMSECVKRALICIDDKSTAKNNAIKCSFNESSMSVTVNQNLSEYEETIALEVPVSAPLEIGFNGRYLSESLNSFISDKLSVKLGSSTQAIIIDDGDQTALVLPVKI